MDRLEFERLRDLPNKSIEGDIVLQRSRDEAPHLTAIVDIQNSAGADAKLKIFLNEETGAKTFNVWIVGVGAICRLDVDSRSHKPCGRNHKHSLQQHDCPHPSVNLGRNVADRPELAGKTIQEAFTIFCTQSNITHNGTLTVAA